MHSRQKHSSTVSPMLLCLILQQSQSIQLQWPVTFRFAISMHLTSHTFPYRVFIISTFCEELLSKTWTQVVLDTTNTATNTIFIIHFFLHWVHDGLSVPLVICQALERIAYYVVGGDCESMLQCLLWKKPKADAKETREDGNNKLAKIVTKYIKLDCLHLLW